MNESPRFRMSQIILGVIISISVASIAGCGTGSLPSEIEGEKTNITTNPTEEARAKAAYPGGMPKK